jgi:GNAT superfamily N-acetyltransferase
VTKRATKSTDVFDPDNYLIRIELPRILEVDSEIDGALEHLEGRILATGEDDESFQLGDLDMYYMQPHREEDFIGLADGEETDLSAAVLDVFDIETGELDPKVSRYYPDLEFDRPNFLYIRRIQLDPKYRGLGIGRKCMETLMKAYEYPICSLIIVKPYPLELLGEKRENNERVASGIERVSRFYHRLGFRKTTKEGHMTYCTLLKEQPSLVSRPRHS